ncbi:MAG: hypothetical protein ACFFDN_06950 [Candidatus Hodarchaeota archaeon]
MTKYPMPKAKKKLTCKKIAYYKEDERKASKEYKELGLKKLSSDEKSHYKFFKRLEKENCK